MEKTKKPKEKPTEMKELMTRTYVAELLEVGYSAVDAWINSGQLKKLKVSTHKMPLISRYALEDFLKGESSSVGSSMGSYKQPLNKPRGTNPFAN